MLELGLSKAVDLLKRMDDLLSRVVAAIPESFIRYLMILLLTVWITFQVSLFSWYYNKIQWFLETILYAVYLSAYIRRPPARDRGTRFHEVIIPLIGASIPFLFLLSPVTATPETFPLVLWLLSGCIALVILSALSLGSNFSIAVDVRGFQRRGMYRLVRHPMYASQISCALVMTLLLRFSIMNVFLLVIFVIIQVTRARIEERKLLCYFPQQYGEYRKKTKMFIPLIL